MSLEWPESHDCAKEIYKTRTNTLTSRAVSSRSIHRELTESRNFAKLRELWMFCGYRWPSKRLIGLLVS